MRLSSKVWYLRLEGTAFEGSSYFGGKTVRCSARLSCLTGIDTNTQLWRFKGAPFSRGLLCGAPRFISACQLPQLSVSSFLPTRFDSAIVLFSSRVASCCKNGPRFLFRFFQRYNNECTPTDWNKTQTLYQLTVV